MDVKLHPHQTKAVKEMHNGCVLKGGVGVGKSITAVAYYFTAVCGGTFKTDGFGRTTDFTTPKDLYVITTAKKRDDKDWERECAHFSISTKRDASHGGVQLKVDSWNNIVNYKGVKGGFFVFDEQRLVGSGAWVKAFIEIAKNNEWVMLSATPGDNWMDYIPVFIANGFYKNRTEFVDRHVVFSRWSKFPKVEKYIGIGRLEYLRRKIQVEMPFERHTCRHVMNTFVEFDQALYDKVAVSRWHIYEDRPIRDAAELVAVMRKLVNSDPSRLGAVMKLMEKHPRLIIFYNFNYELEMLRTLGTTLGVPQAEWNGHKHEPIPEGDKWVYLVQYTAGAEGWNCITTDATIFWSLNYSFKINEQAKGRIDRINTPYTDLYYYILRSGSMIDQSIWKAIATKKTFNEKDFIVKGGFDY